LSLKKPFFNDGTYWLNINDNDFPFIAVVEQTNFVDQKNYNQNSLLYLGGYYPSGHPFFKYNQQQLLKKFLPFLKRINPEFKLNNNLNEVFIFKKPYAQPIMPTGYSRILNQLQKQNGKSVIANMQLIYPYDRGINYAIKIGQEAAGKIN
jgi:protoporphyrinogen oxidase